MCFLKLASLLLLLILKPDLDFRLAPQRESQLTVRSPPHMDNWFILDALGIVLFFEITGGRL